MFVYKSEIFDTNGVDCFLREIEKNCRFLGEDMPKTKTVAVSNDKFQVQVIDPSEELADMLSTYEKAYFSVQMASEMEW